MSGAHEKPQAANGGSHPALEGYTPKATPRLDKVEGGYQPTTGQGTSAAPVSVPKQPSSVQAPRK